MVERQFVCVLGPFRRTKYVERLSQLQGRPEKGGAFAALGPKVVRKCFRSINCTFAGLVLKPGPLSRTIPRDFYGEITMLILYDFAINRRY